MIIRLGDPSHSSHCRLSEVTQNLVLTPCCALYLFFLLLSSAFEDVLVGLVANLPFS